MMSPYSVARTVMTPPGGMIPRYTVATTPTSYPQMQSPVTWIHPGAATGYIMQPPVIHRLQSDYLGINCQLLYYWKTLIVTKRTENNFLAGRNDNPNT